MDFGLLFNLAIGALALLRIGLFVIFCRAFREAEDVHPIYRQAIKPTPAEAEPLQLDHPVMRAA